MYNRPELCPDTVVAEDGHTILYKFLVEGVIYSKNRATADALLNGTYLACVLDAARVIDPSELPSRVTKQDSKSPGARNLEEILRNLLTAGTRPRYVCSSSRRHLKETGGRLGGGIPRD